MPAQRAPQTPLQVPVQKLPQSQPRPQIVQADAVPRQTGKIGVRIRNVDGNQGVWVTHVEPSSPAQHAGIRVGDRILTINGRVMTDTSGLIREVSSHPLESSINVRFVRNNVLYAAKPTIAGSAAVSQVSAPPPASSPDPTTSPDVLQVPIQSGDIPVVVPATSFDVVQVPIHSGNPPVAAVQRERDFAPEENGHASTDTSPQRPAAQAATMDSRPKDAMSSKPMDTVETKPLIQEAKPEDVLAFGDEEPIDRSFDKRPRSETKSEQ